MSGPPLPEFPLRGFDASFEVAAIRDGLGELLGGGLRRVVSHLQRLGAYVRLHLFKSIDPDQGRPRFRRSTNRSVHAFRVQHGRREAIGGGGLAGDRLARGRCIGGAGTLAGGGGLAARGHHGGGARKTCEHPFHSLHRFSLVVRTSLPVISGKDQQIQYLDDRGIGQVDVLSARSAGWSRSKRTPTRHWPQPIEN